MENEILEGIQNFFHVILPTASSSNDWDEIKIQNAFTWATFCEEVYDKVKDEKSKKILDDFLHDLCMPKDVFKHSMCFEDLKHSIISLFQAFFKNVAVDTDDLKKISICDKIKENDIDEAWSDSAIQDNLCIDLVNSLKPISLVDSKKSIYYEVKTEIFLEFLKNTTQHLNKEDKSEVYLSSTLEEMCKNEEQMILLFHLLSYNSEVALQERTHEIQNFIFNWILLKVLSDQKGPFVKFMWTQPPYMWISASSNSTPFFNYYLDFLTKEANSLVRDDKDEQHSWNIRPHLSKDVVLSYQEILSHFSEIVHCNELISTVTREHIIQQSGSNIHIVWKDILYSISQTNTNH